VRRFSDPVEVRVRGESGSGMRGTGERRMGEMTGPAGPAGRPSLPCPPARGRDEGGRLVTRRSPTDPGPAGPEEGEDGEGCDPDQPEAFIWRGRLYVVRSVLATWRERRAWWREALDADEAHVRPGETLAAAARERQVWRVEASPGWSFTPGVYDLAHDDSGADSGSLTRAGSSNRSADDSSRSSRRSSTGSRERERAHPASGWSLVRVTD
jgi:hypothetical protein